MSQLFIEDMNRNMMATNLEKLLFDFVTLLKSGSTSSASEESTNE